MQRVKEEFIHQIEIEKSKFICHVSRCFQEQEAKDYLSLLKKKHPSANHHCYAYVIGSNHELTRSNDDGEPSGTAGSPMLESLRLSGVHDCVCVVVRYFGGIKLGAGGLIRAYSTCVSETLRQAPKVTLVDVLQYQMQFSYEFIGKIDYLLSQKNAILLDKKYDELVCYDFYIPDSSFLQYIQELSAGTIHPQLLGERQLEVDL